MSSAPEFLFYRRPGQYYDQIRYISVGSGKNVVILLPGAVGTIEIDFGPQLSGLDRSVFTVIAWDPPGYGKHSVKGKERKWETDMLDQESELAVELMQFLGYDSFSAVGWSDGAMTAFFMAAKYPEKIIKVVAIAGNAFVDQADHLIYEESRDVDQWEPSAKNPMFEVYGHENYMRLWNRWCDVMKKIYEEQKGDICLKVLDRVVAPTLIVHGREDPAVPLHHAMFLSTHIKNADLWILSGAGHDPHLTHVQRFNAFLAGFFAE